VLPFPAWFLILSAWNLAAVPEGEAAVLQPGG
jgi:hypothetical protein